MMTDKQADRVDNLARLDELQRVKELMDDPEKMRKYIAEREKVLRYALDKPLST